jgi:hypothetical protein
VIGCRSRRGATLIYPRRHLRQAHRARTFGAHPTLHFDHVALDATHLDSMQHLLFTAAGPVPDWVVGIGGLVFLARRYTPLALVLAISIARPLQYAAPGNSSAIPTACRIWKVHAGSASIASESRAAAMIKTMIAASITSAAAASGAAFAISGQHSLASPPGLCRPGSAADHAECTDRNFALIGTRRHCRRCAEIYADHDLAAGVTAAAGPHTKRRRKSRRR